MQRHAAQRLTHQRLFDQWLTEYLTLKRMIQRHRERPAHHRMAAQRAVETRMTAHLQDVADALTLFTQQPASGILKLHFAAGVGAVAELVLEPFDAHGVTFAVWQYSRQKEARQPALGLRQHQMCVALGHREKPFMSEQMIGFAAAATFQRGSPR